MQITGGAFGLEEGCDTPRFRSLPELLGGHSRLYVNARSALYAVLLKHEVKRIWLPSYLCEVLLHPLGKAGVEVLWYGIDTGFAPDYSAVMQNAAAGDALLLINYFGRVTPFPQDELSATGLLIIEDCSQSLYTKSHGKSDYRIYSPRKFLGVPDGGILVSARHALPEHALESPDASWQQLAREAVTGRRLFDQGQESGWFQAFQLAEAGTPTGLFSPASETREILEGHCLDHERLMSKRRENYRILHARLAGYSPLRDLEDGEVPLGYPVVTSRRDQVRQALIDMKIYPPIHWSLKEFVPARFTESHALADRIMTLPCDQRYTSGDMNRVADAFLESVSISMRTGSIDSPRV